MKELNFVLVKAADFFFKHPQRVVYKAEDNHRTEPYFAAFLFGQRPENFMVPDLKDLWRVPVAQQLREQGKAFQHAVGVPIFQGIGAFSGDCFQVSGSIGEIQLIDALILDGF